YRGGQWSRSPSAPRTEQTLEQSQVRDRRTLLWTGRPLPVPEIDRLAQTLVKQDIWLEPLDSDIVFRASTPPIVEDSHRLRPRRNPLERNDEIRLDHGSPVHYLVYSDLSPPPVDQLRAASGPLPAGFGVYTENPPEITAQTKAKALEITHGLTNNYDKAI